MAGGALRRASASIISRLGSCSRSSLQQQQKRSTHETAVPKNKHIEDWLSRRENIEHEFVWNKQTIIHVVMGIVVIPVAIYNAVVWEAHKDDAWADRPKRDMLMVAKDVPSK